MFVQYAAILIMVKQLRKNAPNVVLAHPNFPFRKAK